MIARLVMTMSYELVMMILYSPGKKKDVRMQIQAVLHNIVSADLHDQTSDPP